MPGDDSLISSRLSMRSIPEIEAFGNGQGTRTQVLLIPFNTKLAGMLHFAPTSYGSEPCVESSQFL
jgi:hypothetical protein